MSNRLNARPITPKRNHYFDINHAAVSAFWRIGIVSILNIKKPINSRTWKDHTEAISKYSEKIININLKQEAHNAKIYLCKTRQLNK